VAEDPAQGCRVPPHPGDFGRWTAGAKLYYALDTIGEEERLHKDLFDAIHLERLNYNLESEVTDWLVKKVWTAESFRGLQFLRRAKQVSRAQQLTRAHALNGVPTVIIGGKYMTTNSMTGGSFEPLPASWMS